MSQMSFRNAVFLPYLISKRWTTSLFGALLLCCAFYALLAAISRAVFSREAKAQALRRPHSALAYPLFIRFCERFSSFRVVTQKSKQFLSSRLERNTTKTTEKVRYERAKRATNVFIAWVCLKIDIHTLFWRENSNFFNASIFDVRMHNLGVKIQTFFDISIISIIYIRMHYLGVKIQTFIHISNTSIHNVHQNALFRRENSNCRN